MMLRTHSPRGLGRTLSGGSGSVRIPAAQRVAPLLDRSTQARRKPRVTLDVDKLHLCKVNTSIERESLCYANRPDPQPSESEFEFAPPQHWQELVAQA